MKVSRRKFLAATPLAIGLSLPVKGLALGKTVAFMGLKDDGDSLARLTWDSFYPYITTDFTFCDAGGNSVDLKLTQMEDTRPRGYEPKGNGEECFTLTFDGPLRQRLKQDVYSVEHFALGSFTLLITSQGSRNKRNFYEAVINRITG